MKRFDSSVVGTHKSGGAVRDVAGLASPGQRGEVASFRHALNDPMGTAAADDQWLCEFEEFMLGDASASGEVSVPPDPGFQEQLRRRLWRAHLLTRQGRGGETH